MSSNRKLLVYRGYMQFTITILYFDDEEIKYLEIQFCIKHAKEISQNTCWYEIILKYIHGLTLAFMGDIEFCPVNDGLESKGLESLLDMGGKLASLFLLIDGV